MALLDVSKILEERGDFFNKVRGAVITKAAEIYQEADSVINHTERKAWERDVLLNGNYDQRTREIYRLALTMPTVIANYATLSDEVILSGVGNLIAQVIGV